LTTVVAIANLGWLLGSFTMVGMIMANAHISLVLWRVYMHFPEARTLSELLDLTFNDASEFKRKVMVQGIGYAQSFALYPMLGLLILTMGKSLGMLFHNYHVCLPKWTLLAASLLMPFQTLAGPKLGSYKGLVYVNCATIVATILLPLGEMVHQGALVTRGEGTILAAVSPDLNIGGVLSSLCSILFATTGQVIQVEIMGEMRDPSEFPEAYMGLALPFMMAVFLFVGLVGYYYRGSAATGMLLDNMPFGTPFRIASALLFFHMGVTYLIKGTIGCRALYKRRLHWLSESSAGVGGGLPAARGSEPKAIFRSISGNFPPPERATWGAVVGGVLVAGVVNSQMVPFFSDLVDLLGATFLPLVCWVAPIAMYAQLGECHRQGNSRIATLVENALLTSYVVLAAVVMTFGTTTTLMRVHSNWHTYGGPFACHCEAMWSTCSCSAYHPGMEACAASPGLSLVANASAIFDFAEKPW